MRLTSNSLLTAQSTINPNGDRTLSLRSLQIPLLEHLDTVGDIHEVVDLTDNDLRILGNFPVSIKLRGLLLAKNRIGAIQEDIAEYTPQLNTLSLISNSINSISALVPLRNLQQLRNLFLVDNPVTKIDHYRLALIWLLPQLQVIDFQKIKASERQESDKLYGTFSKPSELATTLLSSNQTQLMDIDKETQQVERVLRKLTDEEKQALKEQLKNASSLDEIERIEDTLKNGYI